MPRSQSLMMKAPQRGQKAEPWFSFKNVSDTEIELDVYGEIGGWSWWDDDEVVSASEIRKELKNNKGKNVTVHINSPGGNVFDGLAIYNALKQHDGTIRVTVDALAASAASFIAMAAAPGELKMARNAVMMIHDAAGMQFGNAADMREMADLLDMHSDNIADIYAQRSGEDASFWRQAMVAETWYTGTEAVAAGLADSVLEDEDTEAEKVANKFDLSIYNYAGREQAPAPSVIHQRIKAQLAQAKEITVSKTPAAPSVKNEAEGNQPPVEEQPEGAPVTEDAPVTEEGGEQEESTTEGQQTEQPAAAPTPTGTEPTAPSNSALTAVVVNGTSYSVPGPVARELTALRTVQEENKTSGRKSFVASLASGPAPKISAAQITATEEFALGLTDDQYEKWVQTWNAAPAHSLFATHGEGTTNHDGKGSTPANARNERIETLEAIVAHHKSAGKTQEQIEAMSSWRELQALKSQSTES